MLWRYASGQSTGSSHEKLGKPCQDRMACATADADATLIAVVADGAGTAELAHIGAEIAVATVSSVAQLGVRAGRDDYQDILREGAALARQRLVEAAAERKADAARSRLHACWPSSSRRSAAARCRSATASSSSASNRSRWRWVFWPQKGEYANTTFFLSDEKALANAEVAALPDEVQDVALMSDGLEPLAVQFATRTAHEPFFRTVLAPLHAATRQRRSGGALDGPPTLLASPAVRSRTDDDASLVIATRRTHVVAP